MINVWGMTDIGLVRKENQDAYAVLSNDKTGHVICVVCDGMGGAKGGRLASRLAADTFMESCVGNLRAGMSAEEVCNLSEFAVEAANRAVYERSREDEQLRGMGTTLVSAIVWEGQALLSNVGDSRAYLIRRPDTDTPEPGSCISRMTKDHSLVERLVDLGNITEEEARRHPDRNLITRAIGPEAEISGDSYLTRLNQGDCLLLCTDGLVDTVTDLEMEREILACGGNNDCLNRFLEISKSRGAADNVTAVLLLCRQ